MQKECSHRRDLSATGLSSQHIMHPVGREGGAGVIGGEGAAFRRVLLLLGACGTIREAVVRDVFAGFSGAVIVIPAEALIELGSSIYFSINRSLFQDSCRRSRIAASVYTV